MSLRPVDQGGPQRVTVPEAAARTGPGRPRGNAVLLNVQAPDEWRAGHRPRAVHLPLAGPADGTSMPSAARVRPVVDRAGGNGILT
ncbi:hypothetical protein [Streptomyces broussonetiae]|uniref:hypothetical protein n=1 Tax=Streptomyces broussonetiae TaxID=2686304 RepID=UPI0035E25078